MFTRSPEGGITMPQLRVAVVYLIMELMITKLFFTVSTKLNELQRFLFFFHKIRFSDLPRKCVKQRFIFQYEYW